MRDRLKQYTKTRKTHDGRDEDADDIDHFLTDFANVIDLPIFELAGSILDRADRKDDFDYDKEVRTSNAQWDSGVITWARDLIVNHGNDLGAIRHFADMMGCWGDRQITLRFGDDKILIAFNNTKTIKVKAEDDMIIFAPGNRGRIEAEGEDVFIYAPGNMGRIKAEGEADARAKAEANAFSQQGDAIAVAWAVADAGSEVFIYSPDNRGTVMGIAEADAKAHATAEAKASSGDAVAIAVAEATAQAEVTIYAMNDHGTTTADAWAVAGAHSDAEAMGEQGGTASLQYAFSSASILIG